MKKRILSFVLALLMVASILPAPTFAVDVTNAPSTQSERLAKITSIFPVLWKDPTNNDPALQVSPPGGALPVYVKIVGEHKYSDTLTLYKLDAIDGETWPEEYDAYRWMESSKLSIRCDKCGEFGCKLSHENWCEICQRDDCGMDHIAGTVTDSNGNIVTDANGEPLVITVTGDLPAGATVSASIPEINGEKLPNVFDIKILKADGSEWQPFKDGKTVTLTIPVDIDAEYVDVFHVIDHADAITSDTKIMSLEGAPEELKALLKNAIEACGNHDGVAVEAFKKVPIVDGKVSVVADSFSIYVPNANGGYDPAPENEQSGNVVVPNYSGTYDTHFPYYATVGSVFTLQPEFLGWGDYTLVSDNSAGVTIRDVTFEGDSGIGDIIGSLFRGKSVEVTLNDIAVGDTVSVQYYQEDGWFSDEALFYIDIHIVREVTVSYDNNGKTNATGMPDPISKVIATDGKIQYTIPEGEPTAANCTFKGWALNNAGTGTLYQAGAVFTLVGDLTFYAIWEEAKFDISFNHNYGSNPQVDVIEDVLHDSTIEFPEPPYRENYTFLGWCASQNGQGDRYNPGDTITVTSAATYYAIWGADLTITISGNINEIKMMEGTEQLWKDVPEGYFSQAGQSANREDVEGFLKGTTFRIKAEGNSNFNAGAGKAYTSSGATVTFWTEDSGKTLFVQLPNGVTMDTAITITTEKDKFTVSYVPNGGTAVQPDLDISSGTYINPYDKITTREGYTFDGWYSDAALTQKVTGAVTITAHTTFYARWTADDYRISYDLVGGFLGDNQSNPATYNTETEEITLVNPTKEGYTFAGWTGTGLTEATMTVTIPTGSTGNRQYIATWTINQYTINYVLTDDNNITGTNHADNPTSYTVESGAIMLKDPTPPNGYKFVEWEEGNTIAAGSTGHKTFTAVWELALADLTVMVSGHRDADQSYVFAVYRGTGNNKTFVMNVVIPAGKTSVTIKDLPVDNYTVTPVSGWAWRLNTDEQQVELNGNKTVEFKWTLIDSLIYWLNGYGYDKKGG